MNEYRYILEPYTVKNSRNTCPDCGKPFQFSKYIDTETGKTLANDVGKCNRVNKCGYHFTPSQYFELSGERPETVEANISKPQPPPRPISYIDGDIFKASLKGYDNNNLVKFLYSNFEAEKVTQAIELYEIGTSARWEGGTTIFWQIDERERVRTGKLIKYNTTTGKRIKNHNNWVHSILNIDNYNLKQCFFGEHLLKQFPNKNVGIVESEKTAIIVSLFLPNLVWLASGGAQGLNNAKVKPLRGRNVILFPDASKDGKIYDSWKVLGEQYRFDISDYLEKHTTQEQKAKGVDIADFLTNIDKPEIEQKREPQAIEYFGSIPYNTPSPVAVIDSKIENPPKFESLELVIKKRLFTSTNGNKIELVGLNNYGFCDNWESHKKANGYCRGCLLNCLHTLKINDVLQPREFTQLEVLMMQSRN